MARAVVGASKLVATLLIALLMIGSVPSSAFAGTLTLSASSGHWGSTLTVTGGGWSGGQTALTGVRISMGAHQVAICETNGSGSLQKCSFSVPDLGPGTHVVSAVDGVTATNTGSANYTILDPAITLNPTGGAGNTSTNVSGSGFKALTTIAFTVEGNAFTPTTPCVTGTTGTFSDCAVTIPFGETAAVPVVVNDNSGRTASASFSRTLTKGTVTLNPASSAPWGTSVTVSGSGWTAGKTAAEGVAVFFDGARMNSCSTSSTGAINSGCTFTVPDSTLGAGHTVTVTDQTNRFNTVDTPYTINGPSITLSSASGTGGSTTAVSGTGFRPNADVQLLFDDEVRPSTCRTGWNGVFSGCSITVPFRPAGTYQIVARDLPAGDGQRTAQHAYGLSLTPGTVTLSPTSGTGGTSVTVSGSGWTANGTTTSGPIVQFDGTQVTRCATSGTGALSSCTFRVPPVAQKTGGYQVKVIDGTNEHNFNSATFTVNAPSITLGSTSGTSGTSVAVTGGGFRANATVEFLFGTTLSRSTCVATEFGALSGCSVVVPSLPSTGSVTVTGRDLPAGDAQRVAPSTNTFNATTVMTLSRTEATPVLDQVAVSGSGWTQQTIELRWGNPAVAIPNTSTCGANSAGELINCAFYVPADTPGGPQTITAITTSGTNSQQRSASAHLDIYRATTLTVAPVTAVYGDDATLSATLNRTHGVQPAANRTVAFRVSGNQVGTAVTNGSGVATLNNVNLSRLAVAGSPHAGAISATFVADGFDRGSNGSAAATITPRTITGAFTANNKVYDRTTAATVDGRSLNGVLSGDAVELAGGSTSFGDKNVGTGKTVTGTGFSLSGAQAGNYSLAATTLTTTATITKKAATISATIDDKAYDGTTAASILTRPVSDVVSGDDVAAAGGTAAFVSKDAANGKDVNVTGLTLTGSDAGNYSFNTSATATATIAKRALAVTATAPNKVYDRTTAATASLGDNRVAGDDLTLSYAQATFADEKVGVLKAVTVSGISVTGPDTGNYTHNASALAFADITAKGVEVTFTAANKVYDGTIDATIATRALDGIREGDVVTVSGGTTSFLDKNVANGKTVRWSNFSLGGADAANYTLASTIVSTTADITPRALTVSAASAGKVYDRTRQATVALSHDGVDPLTAEYTTAEYASKNAAAGKTITVEGITVSGAAAGNYTWNTTTTTTAAITPAVLTVTVNAEDKVYDATTTAAATLGDNRFSGDALTVLKTAANFNTKVIGQNKPVTASGISLTGTDASNYSVAPQAVGVAAIRPKSLVASFTVASKVYDQGTGAAISANGLTGVAGADDVVISGGTAAFTDKNVASPKTATITGYSLSGADAGNYTVNQSATAAAAITPKALTISATGSTRVYDGTRAASATLSDNRIAGDVLGTAYTSATFADMHAATGKPITVTGISTSGADAGNYSANTMASATGSILRRDLAVSAAGVNKVYDSTTAATVNLSDDRVAGDTLTPTYALAAFNDRVVGNGKPVSVQGISVIGDDAANYTVNPTATTTANITKKSLTVTAAGVDKVYDGGTVATVTLSDNRISGDVLTTAYDAAAFQNKNAAADKPVSVTGITISGTDAGNYSVDQTTTTTAAITPKALLVTAAGRDKTYDGTNAAAVDLSDNRLNGDVVTADYTAATFSDEDVAAAKLIAVRGISIAGTDARNYTANTTAQTTAAITPKNVTAAFTVSDKVYDGNTVASVASRTVQGRVGGDDAALTDGSASFANKNVGAAKTVTWSGFTLEGAEASNYNLTNTSATAPAAITPRSLTASATAETKRYDGTRAATVTVTNNRLSGDAVTLNHDPALFEDKNVGTDKDVTVSGIAIDGGADAANYVLANTVATTKAAITAPDALIASFTAGNKTYDGTRNAQVVTSALSGVKSGDTVTLTGGTAQFDTKGAGARTVTWSGFELTGPDAVNYSLGSTTATAPATISPKALTVTATALNREYTGYTAASVTMTSAQLVAGDTVNFSATSSAFTDKNVGNGKTVNVSGIAISGTDAANYTLNNTATSTTANITRRPLSVTATGINKVYDGNTNASVTLHDNRVVASDALTVTSSQPTFGDKNVANAKTVSVTGIAISGADAGNYSLSNTTFSASANITPKPLTVTATGVNKVYDRTITATVMTATSNKVAGDGLALNYTGASFSNALVGTAKPVSVLGISLDGTDKNNYALQNTTAATTADITAKPLTVTAAASDRVYNGLTNATATLATTDRIAPDGVTLNHTSAAFRTRTAQAAKPVDVTGISLGGADASNYALQNTTAVATATVSPKPLAVAATGSDKTYNGATNASVALSAPAKEAIDEVSLTSAPATFADKVAGDNKTITVTGIAIGGPDAGNYSLTNTGTTATANITRKDLTVNAAGVTKEYDGSTAARADLTTTDVVGADVATISSAASTFDTKNVGTGKLVSISGIAISGTDAPNYRLVNSTATTTAAITAKPLTVTASGINRTYDATSVATVDLATASKVRGDELTLHYASASFESKAVGDGRSVSVSGISLDGADKGNYALQNVTAATTANIAKAPLVARFTAGDKTYNQSSAADIVSQDLDGVINNDEQVSLTGATASFADHNAGAGKTVTVSGYTLTGDDAGNYSVNSTATTMASIARRPLNVAATATSKRYDATREAQVELDSDRMAGDAVTLSKVSALFADANVGNGKTVTVSGIAISGGAQAGNYALANDSTTARANIIPGNALLVTFTAGDKTYNGDTAAQVTGYDIDGVEPGDTVALTGGSAAFDRAAAGARTVTWSGFRLDGEHAGNYTLAATSETAPATINPKNLTVTATASDKVYDGNTAAHVALATADVVGGDKVDLGAAPATFEDKNVGDAKIVTATAIELSGDDAGNYALANVDATATDTAAITAKALAVTAAGIDKVYDATNEATVDLSTDDRVAGDDVTLHYVAASYDSKVAEADKDVEVTGLSLGGVDGGNYALTSTEAQTTATITRAPLTAAFAAADKTYDRSADATVELRGLTGIQGDDEVTLTGATGSFGNTNAGEDKTVTVSGYALNGADATNYTVNPTAETKATVVRRTLTATATAADKTYDGTNDATIELANDRLGGDSVTLSHTGATFNSPGVGGTKTVTVSGIEISGGAEAANYELADAVTTTQAGITPRAMTIKADDKAYRSGEAAPAFTSTATGIIPGEEAQVLTGLVHRVYTTNNVPVTPSANTPAGLYTIRPSVPQPANYAVTFENGELNVAAMAPTVAYKANALVSLNNTTYVGSTVINTTGTNQTVGASVARGKTKTFFIKVRNDGKAVDTLKLKGCGSANGQTVTYLAGTSGTTSITSQVVGGTYKFAQVAPGAVKTFRAVVKVGPTAELTTNTCGVAVTSVGLPTAKDVVKFKVTAIR